MKIIKKGINLLKKIDSLTIKNTKKSISTSESIDYKKQKIINAMDYGTVIAFKRDGELRKSLNEHLILVTSHNGSCEKCKKWERQVLIDDLFSDGKPDNNYILLSEAVKQGLFHNGCRHGISTYYPELDDIQSKFKQQN